MLAVLISFFMAYFVVLMVFLRLFLVLPLQKRPVSFVPDIWCALRN